MEDMKDENAVAANMEKMNKCSKLGKLLDILFWLNIAELIMSVLMITISLTAGLTISLGNRNFLFSPSYALLIAYIVNFAVCIFIGIITIIMGKHDKDFILAGIFYIICAAFNSASKTVMSDSKIIVVIASLFSILYILKFTNGMINIVYPTDLELTDGWERLRKVYIAVYGGLAISIIMPKLLKALAFFAAVVILVATIASLVAIIWNIILLHKSANAMKSYKCS